LYGGWGGAGAVEALGAALGVGVSGQPEQQECEGQR